MQAEQTVIELSYNSLGLQQIVEQPLLPEGTNVRTKDGEGVRPETTRLVDGDEDVFKLERFELKVARLRNVSEGSGVEVGTPSHSAAIYVVGTLMNAIEKKVSETYLGRREHL